MKSVLIDNLDFANTAQEVSHEIDVSSCERLQEAMAPKQQVNEKIQYTLTGLPSTFHLPGLALQAEVTIPVVCQRCLQSMDLDVSIAHQYVVAAEEPEPFEGDDDVDWVEASREMNVNALVEEELMIAMPFAPVHAHACKPLPKEEVEKPNPFAVLKDLIK